MSHHAPAPLVHTARWAFALTLGCVFLAPCRVADGVTLTTSPSPPPDWPSTRYVEFLPPGTTPAPEPTQEGLPHWVGLGTAEKGVVTTLSQMLDQVEALVIVGKPHSAKPILKAAETFAAQAEEEHLVLKLHPNWRLPRARVAAMRVALDAELAKGTDPESRQAALHAQAQVESVLIPLERQLPRLRPKEAITRMQAVRQAYDLASAHPHLNGNPAWQPLSVAFDKRIDRLELRVTFLAGRVQLLDQVARMAVLHANAELRMKRGQDEAALGDLAALAEACRAFRHDLKELVIQGFDARQLTYFGPNGPLGGRAFMAQVERWQADADQREELVEKARQQRIAPLDLAPPRLSPPPVPRPPAMPSAKPRGGKKKRVPASNKLSLTCPDEIGLGK